MKEKHLKRLLRLKTALFGKYNVFRWLWEVVKSLFRKGDILHAPGTHIITGYPGSGKTLLMNKIIREIDPNKYFFISNIKEFNDVSSFNITDIFSDNNQVKSFPLIDNKGRHLYAIIFDEINLNFNKRLNRKTDYNDIFIGLVEFLITARHQGVKRIYFIGQKLELQDTQLISLFKHQHDIIKTKRHSPYWFYRENEYIEWIPRKLKVLHKIKSDTDEFIALEKLAKYKITRNDLITYNTAILGQEYAKLDKINLQ